MEDQITKPENFEIDNQIINGVLGFLPGGHVIQGLIEYRGRAKQPPHFK